MDLEFREVASLKDIGPVLQALLNVSGVGDKKVDIDMTIPQAVMLSGYHQLNDRWAIGGFYEEVTGDFDLQAWGLLA